MSIKDKIYLKIEDFRKYDVYYMPTSEKDILSDIDTILDEKYCENDDSIIGVKINIEVVDNVPDDVDWDN